MTRAQYISDAIARTTAASSRLRMLDLVGTPPSDLELTQAQTLLRLALEAIAAALEKGGKA